MMTMMVIRCDDNDDGDDNNDDVEDDIQNTKNKNTRWWLCYNYNNDCW